MNNDFPLFTKTYDITGWILDRTQKFPKSTRFTFGQRIDNLALDVLEAVVEAGYSRRSSAVMQEANRKLTRLRVLLRMSTDRKYLSLRQYHFAGEKIDEIGRMIGGWLKQGQRKSDAQTFAVLHSDCPQGGWCE